MILQIADYQVDIILESIVCCLVQGNVLNFALIERNHSKLFAFKYIQAFLVRRSFLRYECNLSPEIIRLNNLIFCFKLKIKII